MSRMSKPEKQARPPVESAGPSTENDSLFWTEIDNIYNSCVQLGQSPVHVLPLIRNKELTAKITNLSEFTSLAGILDRDAKRFQNELDQIHAAHAGKIGACASDEDMMLAFNLHEQYLAWTERYQSVVLPIISQIAEIAKKTATPVQPAGCPAT